MFKERFNSLYVAIHEFILNEGKKNSFSEPAKEIKFYKSVVDEYDTLRSLLTNILNNLAVGNESVLEVKDLLDALDSTFEKYKKSSQVVRAYLYEQEIQPVKTTFSDKLYRFEQMLISTPLIKIDASEITHITSFAQEYAEASVPPYYYFANNPYNVNDLGLIVPTKHSFDTLNNFVTDVYNYLYGLYTTYLNNNKKDLVLMSNLENSIENKIYEFSKLCAKLRERHIIVNDYDSSAFYELIRNIKVDVDSHKDAILSLGIYRFTRLTHLFEVVMSSFEDYISGYEKEEKYVLYIEDLEYERLSQQFAAYIVLVEDGQVKVDADYVITDTTLKILVDGIIEKSKKIKKKIIYTQKFHISGKPTTLEFEFYQSEMFLGSVKEYYYDLMTNNIYRYARFGIDDYGDSNTDYLKDKFKKNISMYNKFIARETTHLNDFEFEKFVNDVLALQAEVKSAALDFFTAAKRVSLPTYVESLERDYSMVLQHLSTDIDDIRDKRVNDVIVFYDRNKIECRKKLVEIIDHTNKVSKILEFAKKTVFIGMVEYLETKVLTQLKTFKADLSTNYNNGQYIKFLTIYEKFYSGNMVDFNILYAIKKFSDKAILIFENFSKIEELFIYELTNNTPSNDFGVIIDVLTDWFDDETYKVMRSELFYELDIVYEFIISKRPNEKAFLLNEKNLKKLYFDNQLLKMNYAKWYHKIQCLLQRYETLDKTILEGNVFYEAHKNELDNFEQKKRIESLVAMQGRVLAELSKMILEYNVDVNYHTDLSSDVIKNIYTYDITIVEKFEYVTKLVDKFYSVVRVLKLEKLKERLETEHTKQWIQVITEADIAEPEKISFNDFNTFSGTIPFTVGFKAQLETVLDASKQEIAATFKWFIGSIVKDGPEVTHTFYEAGIHDVKCTIKYPDGETFTKHMTFNLSGAQNSQVVKFGEFRYAPMTLYPDVPKLTFIDEKTGILTTKPLTISGKIENYFKDGSIPITDGGKAELNADDFGLIIFGYTGLEFPGVAYNFENILKPEFKYPSVDENEFLFDFKISAPMSGNITVDITSSKFSVFMTKVPYSINSVYEISDAEEYTSGISVIHVITGDRLILKNIHGRFSVLEIKAINSTVISSATATDKLGKYEYDVGFKYFINTSINKYDKNVFSPVETSLTAPTLMFKTDVREMFNTLIIRLEKMNEIKDSLSGLDAESFNIAKTEIATLEEENKKFYLFDELDSLKSKYFTFNVMCKRFASDFSVDFDLPIETYTTIIDALEIYLNDTKSFEEYINSVHAYCCTQNMIDVGVITKIFKDMITTLEIIIDSYSYKKYDIEHFKTRLKEIKMFDVTHLIDVDATKTYKNTLIKLIKDLRTLFFRIKLIVCFPLLTSDKNIIFDSNYFRLKQDASTKLWRLEIENDLFLLNKKLELKYGLEIKKIEEGSEFKDFISDIVEQEKQLFGRGLTNDEIKNLSNYINVVKNKTVAEYDDFFLIPLWLDYLDKNM